MEFPLIISIQIIHVTSLYKKITTIANDRNWTPREVIEHAVSLLFHLSELENIRISSKKAGLKS